MPSTGTSLEARAVRTARRLRYEAGEPIAQIAEREQIPGGRIRRDLARDGAPDPEADRTPRRCRGCYRPMDPTVRGQVWCSLRCADRDWAKAWPLRPGPKTTDPEPVRREKLEASLKAHRGPVRGDAPDRRCALPSCAARFTPKRWEQRYCSRRCGAKIGRGGMTRETTRGQAAYEARAEGASWSQAAREAGSATVGSAVASARSHAERSGAPWPPIDLWGGSRLRVSRRAERGRKAYEARAEGASWREAAVQCGIAEDGYGLAIQAARGYAKRMEIPWPPVEGVQGGYGRRKGGRKGKLAYEARRQGRSWTEAAERSGSKSPRSAQGAAKQYAQKHELEWPLRERAKPVGRAAYEARGEGLSWPEAALRSGAADKGSAHGAAKHYAQRSGRPWPVPVADQARAHA